MLALNQSYFIHLGQHNLLKILKVSSIAYRWIESRYSLLDRHYSLYAKTIGIVDFSSDFQFSLQVNLILIIIVDLLSEFGRLLLNSDFNRTHLILFSQTIFTIPIFITLCHENSLKVKEKENYSIIYGNV